MECVLKTRTTIEAVVKKNITCDVCDVYATCLLEVYMLFFFDGKLMTHFTCRVCSVRCVYSRPVVKINFGSAFFNPKKLPHIFVLFVSRVPSE